MDGPAGFVSAVAQQTWRGLLDTFDLFTTVDGVARIDEVAVAQRLLVVALLLAGGWLVDRVAGRALRGVAARFAVGAETLGAARAAVRYVVGVLTALAVLAQFGLPQAVLAQAAVGAVLVFGFFGAWLVGQRVVLEAVRRDALDPSLAQLLRNVLAVALSAIGFVTVVGQFGVDVLGVITALGVVGIAVGFAAQETLSNFIAGVTLLLERPFRIGDWVEVAGRVGRVERIRLRTTLIVDRDNVQTSIPNAQVASGTIINLTAGGPLRVRFPIGIAYKESAKAARMALLPIVQAHPDVLRGEGREPAVAMAGLGDSSVDLVVIYWLAPERIAVEPRVTAQLREACKEALDAAGIQIPYPHLQLFVDDASGLRPVLSPLYPPRAARGGEA